jgi:alcohol dehydrogenase YqhD (iron-dependent ADH family)
MITTLSFPAKIIFGVGSIANLGKEAAKLGTKTLLVTGAKSARETGLLDRAVNDLNSNGIEVHVFDRIVSNPRAQTIDEGAEIIRQKGLDLIIGLGGGSAMDSAKSLTLATATDKPIWELTTGAVTMAEPEGKPVPLMLASTVAASGSEQDMASVISNWDIRKKRVLVSSAFLSKTSIIDPELTVTVPRIPTAQGGVDIFSHLVEKYVSAPEISEITNGLYGTLLKIVVDDIPIVLQEPDNIEARTRIAWASTMACSPSMFFGGGVGSLPLHPVGFSISGKYDIAHGDAQAALLPAWIEYTRPARPERFEFLAKSGFGKSDMLSATKEWLSKIGMAHSLKSLGAESDELNGIANDCADSSLPQLQANPVGLDARSVADIYRKSF